MRRWNVAVVGIAVVVLYLAISWQARSDQAQDFLTSLEDAVKAIAQSAVQNYNNTCGLQDSCRSEQNCSKRECFPLDGQQFQCVYVHNFLRCNASRGSQCNRILVDKSRSMIRLPSNASLSFPDAKTLEAAVGPTICTQRALDATFKAQKFSFSNESFFYNLYFASVDGVFRFYPAREVLTARCNALEPRARSWYINAISVKKDVVVVLDTGATMTKPYFLSEDSSLDTAKYLTRFLARNLSTGDTLTMISVNTSGPFLVSRLSEFSDNFSATADTLSILLDNSALKGTESVDENPSQFKAAFELANSTRGSELKIIVFFTDSGDGNVPPSDLVSSTLAPIKAAGAGLFVYDLSANASSPWDDALCRSSNNSEPGDRQDLAQQNPLLFLNSYYSFLARARMEANKGSIPFWTKPYLSASDLGSVTTVSFPAMSSDNSVLLGVAGIDVQTGGLTNQLEGGLSDLLDSDGYNQKTTVPTLSTFVDTTTNCSAGYLKSCPNTPPETLQPFCYSSTEPASDATLQRLSCCKYKGCSTGRHGGSLLWIVWIVTAAVLLGAIGFVFLIIRKFNNSRKPEVSPLDISWEGLYMATNRFDDDNIIGKGAFGVVYRGFLGGQGVAVKQLIRAPDRADDFQDELKVNMKITTHRHLVELKGACFRGEDCFLVYELVEGGDLHRWLWPERNAVHARGEVGTVLFLTWNRRKEITRGIATGLDHLHRGMSSHKIFHLDIKPHNILLDRNFTPKIADFGISQLYEPGRTFDIASVRGGSFGYMAPEVLQGHLPNSKMDVYSFGVVLMQLISGRRIDDQDLRPSFIQWARNMVEDGDIVMVIDNHLLEIVQPEYQNNLFENCKKMIDIAMDCTEPNPDNRPEMNQVLMVLTDLREVREIKTDIE